MHRSWRLVPALLLLAALAACGSLGPIAIAPKTVVPASMETIFVASARVRDENGAQGSEPSEGISYASYEVAVPPERNPGQSPRYDTVPRDPERDFVITKITEYPGAPAFNAAVNGASPPDEAFVYVHGFNTKYSNSIFQLAQIGADIRMPAARVLYAWPAKQRFSSYLRDTAVANQSSSGLVEVVEGLARAGIKRITLVGYSLGAVVVFDAVRELKASRSPALSHLGGIVFLSPDLDLKAFHEAAVAIGGMPQPFVVYGSPDDVALRTVAVLTGGGKPRLGTLPDPAALSDLSMIYVDTGFVTELKQPGHMPVATAPSMLAAINAMPKPDLALYAENAASGRIPGVEVGHFGKLTYVTLPKP